MKIVQLISSLAEGGAENLLKEYSVEMKRKGHDVCVVTTDKRNRGKIYTELRKNDIDVICLKGSKISVFLAWISFLKKFKPDVIHGHLKVITFMFFSNPKTKLVYTFHSDLSRLIKLWGKGFVFEMRLLVFFRKMQIIALHNNMASEAKKLFKTQNVQFLENCIDLDKYQLSESEIKNVKRELGISDNAFVVGHIGRFIDVKNHKRVICLYEKLYRDNPNGVLILIGDGEEKKKIEAMVKGKEYCQNIKFLGIRDDVPRVLNVMDVFLMPSFIEGFPITVIESQAAGVRTIVSKAIPPEAIRKETTVRIDLKEDDTTWIDAILGKINNNEKIFSLKDCDVKVVVDKLICLYQM